MAPPPPARRAICAAEVRKSYAGQDEGPANWSTKHFDDDESDQEEEELPHKKRGRSPAAGKTVQQKSPNAHAALPGHNKKRGRPHRISRSRRRTATFLPSSRRSAAPSG